MEGLKKKAIEKLREQRENEYNKAYRKAFEMAAEGKLSLKDIEQIATSDEPQHDVLLGESEAFIEGFVGACSEMLRETREES